MVILRVGLVSLYVFELDLQSVVSGGGEQVDDIIS